ncbi:MAG: HTH-type transcriptional activator IlvY [Pseudomonadales bacterium]
MDTKSLKLFINLAETLHFGRASELSHISVSALSRNIAQLEEQLGVKLFERDNRSVSLTNAGQDFIRYAREALNQWDAVRFNLQQKSLTLNGELSVYCSVTASYSFLYEILRKFRLHYPEIEIKLHTGDAEHALSKVLSGSEDIAMGAAPAQLASGLVFQPIATSPLLFIAPRHDQQLIDKANCQHEEQLAELWQNIPMIVSEQGVAREHTDRWFKGLGVKPKIYAQVAGNEAIVSMVSLGFGVGIVPEIVLHNSPLRDAVSVVRPPRTLEPYKVGLFTLVKKLKNPLVRAFWELRSNK